MKVGLVAVHYPRHEHWDEMISRVREGLQARPRMSRARAQPISQAAGFLDDPHARGWLSLFAAQLASRSSAAAWPASAVRRRKLAMASSSSSS